MHKSFHLQGGSFDSAEELISFAETISKELHQFLSEWFDDESSIVLKTSGSTGIPKTIHIKKQLMKNSAKSTGDFFDLGVGTRALCCLSVTYIAGKMMVVRALELGWDLDFVAPVNNPLAQAFDAYDFCAMVPLQVKASLWDLHLVKKLLIGGGVVTYDLCEHLQGLSTECFASYGMTETVSHIAIKKLNSVELPFSEDRIGSSVAKKLSLAKRNPYVLLPNISISQDDRRCLVIDAPLLNEEKVITNDMVDIYSETEFEWLGRYDHVINSGGVKLHPEEIEKELSKIISKRFFVAGIPDQHLGEKLVLIIEGKPEFYDFSNVTLSKYQTPKQIIFVDEFVSTVTKKIQRKKTLDLITSLK
ncbi:MAG: AMP-binding protein [Wenyingzhuangia sp.]|jgi:o-succinylbenzoate---CoA ligase|uniref:AMP-binding protein n=1 Tax=Wenyingzhuangia sp. TaxID=1964193 RepID=UPI00321956FC